jgi:hypothetical protein
VPAADPEAAFVAGARASLAAGKAVTLVGPAGAPAYQRWRLGPGEVRTLKDHGGAFAIVSRGYAFLELFPDPGIDGYTLSAEVRHVEAAGAINVPPVPMLHTAGLYVGYDHRAWQDESQVHTFGAIAFSDFLPANAAHTDIFYRDMILYERRLQPTVTKRFSVGSTKGDPAGFPGPWRPLAITLTPGAVAVASRGHPFASQDENALRARSDRLQAWADQRAPGLRLHGWSSRRPLGVWVNGSCAAIRNVTITPLPPPNLRN